jgi:hypothetical protein
VFPRPDITQKAAKPEPLKRYAAPPGISRRGNLSEAELECCLPLISPSQFGNLALGAKPLKEKVKDDPS